jgi:hypothetical protein
VHTGAPSPTVQTRAAKVQAGAVSCRRRTDGLGRVVGGHPCVGAGDVGGGSDSVVELSNGVCISDGCGLSVAAGEGCGHAGEQQIEEAVQLGGAVVAG